jgi:hypothetical protein
MPLKSFISIRLLTALRRIAIVLFALLSISMISGDRKKRVQECASKAGDGAIFLKEFVVSIPKGNSTEPEPAYRETVLLRDNNIYRFNVCNDRGKAIISLYDKEKMFITSYQAGTNRSYNPINFLCRRTGQYYVVITTKNGRAGETVVIMSHVVK